MRWSEDMSFWYFASMTAMSWLRPLPLARRLQVTSIGAAMCAVIRLVAARGTTTVRDWAPPLFILVGYYVSGRFFVRHTPRFESWLIEWDRRLLGDPPIRFARWPRVVLAYLEVVYIGCFLLLPAGFAALVSSGHASEADRYWTMVTAAELGSFAPLAVLQSRPPWVVERKAVVSDRTVHRAASLMVEHLTIRANTFPSGHVAGSLAVALGVIGAMPLAGGIIAVLAVSIALACVAGRYHYTIDVISGAALALLIWMAVEFAHPVT